jgi:hypothetical protein
VLDDHEAVFAPLQRRNQNSADDPVDQNVPLHKYPRRESRRRLSRRHIPGKRQVRAAFGALIMTGDDRKGRCPARSPLPVRKFIQSGTFILPPMLLYFPSLISHLRYRQSAAREPGAMLWE